jgi:hypothetical protein
MRNVPRMIQDICTALNPEHSVNNSQPSLQARSIAPTPRKKETSFYISERAPDTTVRSWPNWLARSVTSKLVQSTQAS